MSYRYRAPYEQTLKATVGIQTKPEPHCPACGGRMKLRRPKPHQDWKAFWGCQNFPECEGSRNIGEDGKPEEATSG